MDASSNDRYYIRNVFGISAVEFLWGLGLPVVVESTFLQLFLKNLGASGIALTSEESSRPYTSDGR